MVNDQVGNSSNNIGITAIDPKSVLVENSANSINGTSTNNNNNNNNGNNGTQPSAPSEVYNQASNSPPMAVLPLNPSAKLDQEPNPFEQSFSNVSKTTPPPHPTSISDKVKPIINTNNTNTNNTNNNTNNNDTLKLPPVAAMTSPSAPTVMSSVPKDIANQYTWDSLRAGPLSPSMLQRPANPDDFVYSSINPTSSILSYSDIAPNNTYQIKSEPYYSTGRTTSPLNTKYQEKQSNKSSPHSTNSVTQKNHDKSRASISSTTSTTSTTSHNNNNTNHINNTNTNTTSMSNNNTNTQRRKSQKDDKKENDDDKEKPSNKKRRTEEEDEKRKNFLERNRLAALKCRQRKKQWLNNLQAKVEFLTNDNEQLQMQTNALREEIMNLKTLLLAHKDCPISQANGFPNLNLTSTGPTTTTNSHPSNSNTTTTTNTNTNTNHPTTNTNPHILPPPTQPSSTGAPVSMAPLYTSQTYPTTGNHHHGRVSSSSTSSNTLNMVMVPQQQVTAPPSSGVMQF
ncbi:unnamed protein product [Cunninghamella blakesleeana]